MKNRDFGERLKELRKQAGFSQRELADLVGVDFTYLSKIEGGTLPPPSEKVVLRLAEALKADADELMLLAGKIPDDIAQMLKNQETLQLLRSRSIHKASSSVKQGKARSISFKKFARAALAVTLVGTVAASLWFSSPLPVKALDISFPTFPSSGTLGSTYSFKVKISIADSELLPIQNIDLKIYNTANSATYYDQYTDLALGSTGYGSYASSGTGTTALIKATPDSMWEYFTSGAGYVEWQGAGYTFAVVGGYGYSTGTGTTSITYDINWTPPSNWPEGGYKVDAKITAQDSQTFTQTSSQFTISEEEDDDDGDSSGGGGVSVIVVTPGVTNISSVTSDTGVFTRTVTAQSSNGNANLNITTGTIGRTQAGNRLTQLSITIIVDPPGPPSNANFVGSTYDLGPDGATFDPPITLSLTYNPADIPAGVSEEDLAIAWWNQATGEWVILDGAVINTATHTISAPVSHFTPFAILAMQPVSSIPAAFTTSGLTVSPAEVNSGEAVTIKITVTNTGGLTESYQLSLKINNVVEDTKSVTLAGGASQVVSFTANRDAAGPYTVAIDSLSDTFTVRAPSGPSVPAAFTTSGLSVSPAEVSSGETVTIRVTVTNTGGLTESYQLALKINNATEETRSVTLAGGASQVVSFAARRAAAGTYTVAIDNLSGAFTVKALAPVNPSTPWWLIIGIIAAVILIGLASWVVIRRRMAW
ncbi:MAG: helix-turn-helix domain-containing protein [Dehalococcoidales bacterium]|nr:helix-turn-helix domain-containing protein [Dehalococcoidales bacterium]